MTKPIQLSPKDMISAYLLFFVIHGAQVGVGIQGFQRIVYQDARQDAWISVLLAGIASHIVAFFMIKTLEIYGSNDLYGIQQDIFGKWIGNLFNAMYVLYCSVAFFSVLRNYIEVIQVWLFPGIGTWFLSATLLIVVIYAFTGGLRVIVGLAFFSIILSLWIFPMLAFPLKYSVAESLLPVLENDFRSILKGTFSMTFTIIGFEVLNVIYPFVKEKKNVQKHVHLGLLFTTFIYLSVMLVSITYYSEGKLLKTIWATLTLFSFISFPFIERFEFIAVCYWMLIILPNMCLYLWAAYRGAIRLVNISGTKFVWLLSFFVFIGTLIIQTRTQINTINTIFGHVAFYVIFVYPILLWMLAVLKKNFTSKKVKKDEQT
ncbi:MULTISPECIES: GerAB/ArcD/ProY family transporter [Lysinibacillus]|uniref:GerAB/ArcD/ProY family transporter n=1 Tax=Lysinibacillus irui TaxID=2998077 RepID=A0AAJ5RR68_9BACI|nr:MULTISPECIES: GerAB/ArcD/ProY family transporter [Lysinibacillus]MEA0562607.1 GerAB/ArcD/ProY family transporter [Lysinibacillus irui]WDV08977.1 GerAB/ArcD/ProY family transporter [Lysinibacillus irui]